MSGGIEIFISYAHADDAHPRYDSREWDGPRGWVECFYDALKKRLRQARGREVGIWLDQRGGISGSSVLTPTIKAALAESAILLSIVSPAYAESTWCKDELKFFCAAHEADGLEVIASRGVMTRVVRVNKLPLRASFPGDIELPEATGYNFFRSIAGKPLEFEPPRGAELGTKFCEALNDLAYDLVDTLDGGKHIAPVPSTGVSIFLADTTDDVIEQRKKLRGALLQLGHTVLPPVPRQPESTYSDRVRTELARTRLSIHVVGRMTDVPDSARAQSIAETQYELAGLEAARRAEFRRVTWIPPEISSQPSEKSEAAWIDHLKATDSELLIVDLPEVRFKIDRELKRQPEPDAPSVPANTKFVYLIFDRPDESAAAPVRRWLHEQGFEVLRPLSSGDSRKMQTLHARHLRDSDGVLIYYGNTTEEWIETKLSDLRRIFGKDRAQKGPWLAKGVFLADPDDHMKRDLLLQTVRIIPGFGPFQPGVLNDFTRDLRGDGAKG